MTCGGAAGGEAQGGGAVYARGGVDIEGGVALQDLSLEGVDDEVHLYTRLAG